MADIRLADAIRNLREELSVAMKSGAGEDLRFQLGPIELEANIQVSREGKADGKVQWLIFSAGVEGKASSSATHKIKLVLKPVSATGDDILVGSPRDRRPD